MLISQITTAASATAGIIIALVTGAAAIAKKCIGRKDPGKPEYITDDSHCDRFWAKALRQEAARTRDEEPWIMVG